MQRLFLWTALLLGGAASAQDGTEEPVADAVEALPPALQQPPATVLNHEVQVYIDASRRSTTRTTWEIRIDDPEACSAGLLAPTGLDGARDRGGAVLGDTLVVPPTVQAGTVYTLSQTTRGDYRGSHSGAFLTAPDLPTAQASFTVEASSTEPLHVWHDPSGALDVPQRGRRKVQVTWDGIDAGEAGEVVWSTWSDWMVAGTQIARIVDQRTRESAGLGRDLAAGVTGLHIADVTERVFTAIALDPTGPTDWTRAQDASVTVRAARGSVVDRGVVLISTLRLAGHDAEPGYFRSSNTRGEFPLTVPAPAMLGQPMIVVHRSDGDVYIDPANELVAIPTLPASMSGGVVWLPGDLPVQLPTRRTVDGEVHINASLTIGPDGSSSWQATMTASRAGEEWLRQRLQPLNANARVEALRRLALAGRPDLKRFAADLSGIDKATHRVKISISGHDERLLERLGAGLNGEVPALMAPSLAAWLPPNVHVTEVMSVSVPHVVEIIAATPPRAAFDPLAIVARHARYAGARLTLSTTVERPYRVSTASTDASASTFLAEEGARGHTLVVHAPANKHTVEQLRGADLDPADLAVLEALLWSRSQAKGKARRALREGMTLRGGGAVADSLLDYAANQPLLWTLLLDEVTRERSPEEVLAVASAAGQAGLGELAWLATAQVGADEALLATARVDALLLQESLQPEVLPDDTRDKEAQLLWQPSEALLALAETLVGADDPRLLFRRARRAIDDDDGPTALSLLERVPLAARTTTWEILTAQAMTTADGAVADILAHLDRAIEAAPRDPEVIAIATEIVAGIGLKTRARDYALKSARLVPIDPTRWDALVPIALAAGDLPVASLAAHAASDLVPGDQTRAETLGMVSCLLHDRDGWDKARARHANVIPIVTEFPPSLETIEALAPADSLLAVLQYHDSATVADARLLALRAQLRVDAGLLDEAARDGILLATRHDAADGIAIAWAASAGSMYSTSARKNLRQAAEVSLSARATQMEVALLLGDADPTVTARQMSDDPRGQIIARLRSDPKGLAAEVEGWPTEAKSPWFRAPRGYRTNRWLGASPGVMAVSNPDNGTSILRTAQVTGLLPAPLAQLYMPAPHSLLSTEDGAGQVFQLQGGPIPLFAAIAVDGEQEVIALGFSVEAAARALALATP